MKRIIAVLLTLSLALSGCDSGISTPSVSDTANTVAVSQTETTSPAKSTGTAETDQNIDTQSSTEKIAAKPAFTETNDQIDDIESAIFKDLNASLDPERYRIDNVSAVYISKEFLEELSYNSQSNIFFGYSLAEIDAQFQGTRYVFTLDENGETAVVPFEEYDDTYETVLKNVAVGAGIIIIFVTVSAISGAAGATAVSMIFMTGAKGAAVLGVSSGAISAVTSGAVVGMKTGNFEKALKAGALAGSEEFKWGAILGSVTSGASELLTLKNATKGGLALNEAADIIKKHKVPANFVKQIHSMDEYNELLKASEKTGLSIKTLSDICMKNKCPLEVAKVFRNIDESTIYFDKCGLVAKKINGKVALIRSIDLEYKSEIAGRTVTNLERMRLGHAAIDPATGQPYQLHHIGQRIDSPLAILTQSEHTGDNNRILHDPGIEEGVHKLLSDSEWASQREEFWISLAEYLAP